MTNPLPSLLIVANADLVAMEKLVIMRACRIYSSDHHGSSITDLSSISELLKDPDRMIWLDLVSPQAQDFELIASEFDLHPLAIEDALKAHQRPKIEAYPGSWFIIVQAATRDDEEILLHEIAIFAGRNFIITVRADPAYPLTEIERRWAIRSERLPHDSGALLYTILDTIVDAYAPLAEDLEERVSEIESVLLGTQRRAETLLVRIFEMRKRLHLFHRAVAPMRDIFIPILRGDFVMFREEELPYYRDVNDHIIRVADQIAAINDSLHNARETHLSIASHHQNEITKQLTLVASIFLPLTFVTGFFGQNFGWMINHITGEGSFWWLGVGCELIAVIGLLGYFRYKRWF